MNVLFSVCSFERPAERTGQVLPRPSQLHPGRAVLEWEALHCHRQDSVLVAEGRISGQWRQAPRRLGQQVRRRSRRPSGEPFSHARQESEADVPTEAFSCRSFAFYSMIFVSCHVTMGSWWGISRKKGKRKKEKLKFWNSRAPTPIVFA